MNPPRTPSSRESSATGDPLSDPLPTLKVTGGPLDGTSLALEGLSTEKVLGSGPGCDLRLELANISPVHARLVWDARGLVIVDAGSATGTFVNGEKIEDEHVLGEGDRVFLGPPGSKESAKLLASGVPAGSVEPGAEGPPIMLEAEAEPMILDGGSSERAGTPAVILDDAASTPAPQPAAPAAEPPKSAAPVSAPRTLKPEYTTELPSMAPTDRVREAIALPPAEAPKARKTSGLSLGAVPRPVLVGFATLVLAGGALVAYRAFQQPPPVLTGIMPPRVEPGQTVTLNGVGFDTTPEKNLVHLGTTAVGRVTSASETQLAVTVPADLPVSEIPVKVQRRRGVSNAIFLEVYRAPRLEALEPRAALPGSEVLAKGKYLVGPGLTVTVGGQPAEILDPQSTALHFRVPPGLPLAPGKSVPVNVKVGKDSARPMNLILGELPLVLEAVPPRGMPGDRVALKGLGFDASPSGNAVTFGGRPALVLAASESELAVIAPGAGLGETQVETSVVVRARGATSSSPCSFTVIRPSLGVYLPHYFAAPVTDHLSHDHAFVSTELGPVLLLTGKADAASTAERAARVAATLNQLTSGGKAPALELRQGPTPAVGVAGGTEVIAAATPEDAAGYDEPWDPSVKARKSTPRGIAAYWTALLQDHMLIFFGKERPFRVLELSSRGKALRDLYVEAVRRGGPGQGVPSAVVNPLSSMREKELRDMALLLPAEGQAAGAVGAGAVEGRWAGTMEESTGQRTISVRLRMEGARLAGSLSTKAGGLTMDVPLRDLAYQKGALTFVAVLGGSPRHFNGTVQGESITGTIHPAPGKEPIGRFALKYVE